MPRRYRSDAPAAAVSESERILAAEREQQRIAAATAAVAGRILDLLKTIRANHAADPPTVARWETALKELTALSQQRMARVVTALGRARLARADLRPDLLRTASIEQRAILSRLLAILRAIETRVAFAGLVDEVEQLIREQRGLKERTVGAARRILGMSAGELAAAERRILEDLAEEQRALRDTFQQVEEAMKRLAERARDSARAGAFPEDDPAARRQSAAVARALDRLRTDRPDRDIARAAAALGELRPVDAAQAQQEVLRKLRLLRDILQQGDSDRLRRVDALLADLDRLARSEEALRRRAAETPQNAPPERFRELAREQNPLTHRTGELAESAERLSEKAGGQLRSARSLGEEAERRLAARRPADAARSLAKAVEHIEKARSRLEALRTDLARRAQQAGETDPLQKLEQAAQAAEKLAADQDRARQELRRALGKPADATKPREGALQEAGRRQRSLAERTGKLAEALDGSASSATRVTKRSVSPS